MIEEKRLKRGNRVTVYEMPKGQVNLEGEATLITHQQDGGCVYLDEKGYEIWSMRFDHRPNETVNRIVHLRDLQTEQPRAIASKEVASD